MDLYDGMTKQLVRCVADVKSSDFKFQRTILKLDFLDYWIVRLEKVEMHRLGFRDLEKK
jgi:hypothetical protein